MPIDMKLHRGEKAEWWPDPEIRLISGMTIREPWRGGTSALWTKLKEQVRQTHGQTLAKKLDAYSQYLIAEGRPFALATAWTEVGSFSSDYNYTIGIRHAYLFTWGGTADAPEVGPAAVFTTASGVDSHYIVLDAQDIMSASVLGFGHNRGTKEVTFFHDLPFECVLMCNGRVPTKSPKPGIETPVVKKNWYVKKRADLSMDDKIKYGKILRN